MKQQENPFESHSIEYDRWFESENGARIFSLELDCLKQTIGAADGKWLEVGIGSGRFAHALGIAVGVDPSPAMVRISVERGIETHLASGEKLPFEDASFDNALMVCTICFLHDPQETLRECKRVLKENGHLIIGFIPADSPWGVYYSIRGKHGHTFYTSARFYRLDEIRKLAESVGFSYQAEHDKVLPEPYGLSAMSDTGAQILRDESFVVFSFIKNK